MNEFEIRALVTAEMLDPNWTPAFVDEIYEAVRNAMESEDPVMNAIAELIFNGEVTVSWDYHANDIMITRLERSVH